MHVFKALYAFCGAGGGALGMQKSRARLFGKEARFEVIGGIDFSASACRNFELLTEVPAWCADVSDVTAPELRQRFGAVGPDMVFLSPPCKGASGLLSAEKAATAKYQAMNQLALVWMRVMLEAWGDAPPKFVLLENVPRLKQRAPKMLSEIRKLLKAAGYVFTDGFHDCGELGGLAQVRRRYLLVARHAKSAPPLLYQPPKRRVRGCGEVLGALPFPGDPAAGPMHRLPRLSWLNWVRLALIPAGGDWRDLNDVLTHGQPRREVFRRHHVERWEDPSVTIAGTGSNGPSAVADPRVGRFGNVDRVTLWSEPMHTVTSSPAPSSGAGAVADPRLPLDACKPGSHHNKYRVENWDKPAHTVIGADRIGSGAPSVADPRIAVKRAYDHGYGVLRWDEPSSTVAGGSAVGQGAYSVADLRFKGEYYRGTYGVLGWEEAAGTITGNARIDAGKFCVADPRKPPPDDRIIIAADGTWHRPLTTLELAALQSFPVTLRGKPLVFDGTATCGWREQIGNAVPPDAAEAIGDRMLVALLQAELGGFALASQDTPVWISPPEGTHAS